MFSGASNFVQGVDTSFAVILGISLFFLIGITAVMIFFVFRYRKDKNPKASNIKGSHKLELIWTIIPTLLVLVMFYYGWVGYKPMRNIPDDAIPIKAYAQMWSWNFEYENGKFSDTLVVPINKAVKLDLISRDVIHSLYIPAFRIKEDVVPGVTNKMWFIGQELGDYDILCAEYCGDRHSYMLSKVYVVEENKYNDWYHSEEANKDQHPGIALIKKHACTSCHSLDGSKLIGPSFKGIWGNTETVLRDGQEVAVTVDEEYILHSIFNPNDEIVKGYNKGLMISYQDLMTDEEAKLIADYIKTLKFN